MAKGAKISVNGLKSSAKYLTGDGVKMAVDDGRPRGEMAGSYGSKSMVEQRMALTAILS